MTTVGMRTLKAQLSYYVSKAKAGETVIVTEYGKEVAELSPISRERLAIGQLAKKNRLQWSGNKPKGHSEIVVEDEDVSTTILDDRR